MRKLCPALSAVATAVALLVTAAPGPAAAAAGAEFAPIDRPGAGYTTGDTQIASEYVVNAIRAIYARTGRKVQVIGHSQGGTEPRFALRFWPDLRHKVDDYIALAATNHGSPLIRTICVPNCSPALWQQLDSSNYVKAMNSYQETPGPADPKRIDAGVCAQTFMPGVDPRTFPANLADAWNRIMDSLTTDPRVDGEPPLKAYTMGS